MGDSAEVPSVGSGAFGNPDETGSAVGQEAMHCYSHAHLRFDKGISYLGPRNHHSFSPCFHSVYSADGKRKGARYLVTDDT